MKRTQEEAAQTRQSLLDAALSTFSRQGFAATRLEDVAEAAGVTRGAIYHHFGGKAELFLALIEDASTRGSSVIGDAIAQGGSFVAITRRVLESALTLLEDDHRFREITALSLFNAGGSPELEPFVRLRREQARTQVEQIAGFFQAGIQQGVLRDDLPAEAMARAFLGLQNGLAMLWLSNPDLFSIKKEASRFADVFLSGIVAGRPAGLVAGETGEAG
jgi:TetR/AcrR family acrAB operon transcriptional repressor